MDQAFMQSFDLQLFADEAGAEMAEQPQETPAAEQPEKQGAEDTAEKATLDYSKLGSMSQDEQLAALSKAGYFGQDDKPAEKPQDTPQQAETPEHKDDAGQGTDQPTETSEPEYEIVVDGEKVKVKQSELLAGYQRQADLT